MASIDLSAFREREARGLITCRAHPTADLLIWNYTPTTQFAQAWDEVTIQARGLITTPSGEIVARPFKKFWNLDEHLGDLPLEPFSVTAKMDGSLGIGFFHEGVFQIATRGSFTSEQAMKANKILARYPDLPVLTHRTYLFEILYPENRIVVDYGAREELILLAEIVTDTGRELDIHDPGYQDLWSCPIVKRYDGIHDIAQLRALQEENAEGFVIRFESGLRLKLKFAEYVRLHRLLTKVNARVLWDLLKNGQPFDNMLERVPDEFYTWVRRTRDDLTTRFSLIETQCQDVVNQVKDLPTRKEQAAIIAKTCYPGIAFSMLDRKNYQEAIWKLLQPEATRPFKIDEEG